MSQLFILTTHRACVINRNARKYESRMVARHFGLMAGCLKAFRCVGLVLVPQGFPHNLETVSATSVSLTEAAVADVEGFRRNVLRPLITISFEGFHHG